MADNEQLEDQSRGLSPDRDDWESPLFDEQDDYYQYLKELEELRKQRPHRARIKHLPNLGRFEVINTTDWNEYKSELKTHDLSFDPGAHKWFDGVIAEESDLPALKDPTNPKYAEYEEIRDNIAVIRNCILNHYFPDGHYEPEDMSQMEYARDIAYHLGGAIKNGARVVSNPFTPSINFKHANTDCKGAFEMYSDLIRVQETERRWNPALQVFNTLRGYHDQHWRLPPIEEMPFYQPNIEYSDSDKYRAEAEAAKAAAAATAAKGAYDYLSPEQENEKYNEPENNTDLPENDISNQTDLEPTPEQLETMAKAQALEEMTNVKLDKNRSKNAAQFDDVGSAMVTSGLVKRKVDSLDNSVKHEAIQEAKNILKNLRIGFGNTHLDALMHFAPETFSKLMAESTTATSTFYDHVEQASDIFGPEFKDDPIVAKADAAVAKLGTQAKLFALNEAQQAGDFELASNIDKELEQLPPHWRTPPEQTVGELFDQIEEGIDYTTQRLEMAKSLAAEAAENNERMIDPLAEASIAKQAAQDRDKDRINLGMEEQYQQDIQQKRQRQKISSQKHSTAHKERHAEMSSARESSTQSKSSNAQQTQSSAAQTTAQGNSKFDNLLGGSDISKMRNSMNAKTSGNFDVAAPNNAQKMIAQQAQKKTQNTQKDQQKRTQQKIAHKSHQAGKQEAMQDRMQNLREDKQASLNNNLAAKKDRGGVGR